MPIALIVFVLGVIIAPASAKEAASGTINICRVAGFGDVNEGKRVEIPKGAVFGDTGRLEGPNQGGPYWPLWITTIEAVTIEASERCAAVMARITTNMDRHRLQVIDARLFMPSTAAHGALPEWPGGRRLTATATADFK